MMLKQDICKRCFNQNSQLCKICNYINLDYQQHSKSLIKKYSNITVKHKVSTTLIEQSLIANMFQAFSELYHSAFALGVKKFN